MLFLLFYQTVRDKKYKFNNVGNHSLVKRNRKLVNAINIIPQVAINFVPLQHVDHPNSILHL